MTRTARWLILYLVLSPPGVALSAMPEGAAAPLHDDPGEPPNTVQGVGADNCIEGVSGGYPCRNVSLLARLTLEAMGGTSGNDSWGWKDPESGRYYALMGLDNGVSFIDISAPEAPVIVGKLRSPAGHAPWRDVKTYANHAFVVADTVPQHGLQVFDLTRLRGAGPNTEFDADLTYDAFGSAHNVAIDESTGFAYVVGSDRCDGGLHIVDIRTPSAPKEAGCFSDDGYTHDVFCTTYGGPHEAYIGRELCFAANEDSLTVVDVTNKAAPALVGKSVYPGAAYSHQGWLSDDHRYFLLGDEGDELTTGMNARTLVFDVSRLDAPALSGRYLGPNGVIDHNLYVRGPLIYQANYAAGLRILLAENMAKGAFREIAYFDTVPQVDLRDFQGAWNVYPFFDSGVLLVSDMHNGLFILEANLPASAGVPINGRLSGAWVARGLQDQGLTLFVDENHQGPFLFYAWHLYRDGQPFWVSGAASFEYGAEEVEIRTERLQGLGFLDSDENQRAERIEIGTLHLHAHSCNEIHLNYDFGPELGSGELSLHPLVGVEGRNCR